MPLDNISELRRRVPGGKYALTRAVAERARQLQSGTTPLVEVRTPNPLSVAIDEIVQGKVTFIMHEASETVTEVAEDAETAADPTDELLTATPDAEDAPAEAASEEAPAEA